jgi:hypothetical protein
LQPNQKIVLQPKEVSDVRKTLNAHLICVLLGTGALLAGGCEYQAASESKQALRQETRRATAPDQVTEDARFFIYENDRPRALVNAQRMERYETEDSTYTLLHAPAADSSTRIDSSARADSAAGRVTARIFSGPDEDRERASRRAGGRRPRRDSVSAVIRANRIVYHDADRRFDARGRVIVTTPSGKRIESEHLVWREDQKRITTPDFVTITTPTDRIQGYRLRADETFDTYQLGRVTGRVTVEDTP